MKQEQFKRCGINLVSPRSCKREAVTTRITKAGRKVSLCALHDKKYGSTIGEEVG